MKRLALAVFLSVLPLAGQTSSLQGTVTDPQGSVIPAAIVNLTNTDTSAVRRAVASETGVYEFLQIPPAPTRSRSRSPVSLLTRLKSSSR